MKNVVLASIALSALMTVGRAGAADAPVSAAKAPAVSASPNWTGFYLGGHIGAGFSYRDWEFADHSVASDSGDAFIAGGQIGFNYQIGKWVLGGEADMSWGNLRDQSPCPDGLSNCRTKQSWLATSTGRLGYAFDPALFYLKGGAAFTHADHFKEGAMASPFDEAGGGYRAGWTVGAGMESR
jgi:outer membrane immunogenic protein